MNNLIIDRYSNSGIVSRDTVTYSQCAKYRRYAVNVYTLIDLVLTCLMQDAVFHCIFFTDKHRMTIEDKTKLNGSDVLLYTRNRTYIITGLITAK